MIKKKHVAGEKKGEVLLYALSTCVWCKMTKNLLNSLGVAYEYIDVDLVDDGDKEKVTSEIKKWNPLCSFPTLVFNGKEAVLGYDEKRIREALKL